MIKNIFKFIFRILITTISLVIFLSVLMLAFEYLHISMPIFMVLIILLIVLDSYKTT